MPPVGRRSSTRSPVPFPSRPLDRPLDTHTSATFARQQRSDSVSTTKTIRGRPPPLQKVPSDILSVDALAGAIEALGSEDFLSISKKSRKSKTSAPRKVSPPSLSISPPRRAESQQSKTSAGDSTAPPPSCSVKDAHATQVVKPRKSHRQLGSASLPACNDRLPQDCVFIAPTTPGIEYTDQYNVPQLSVDFRSGFQTIPAGLVEWHDQHWASHTDPDPNWTFPLIPDTLLPRQWAYESKPEEKDRSIRRKTVEILKDSHGNVNKIGPQNLELSIQFWDAKAPYFTLWNLKKFDKITIPIRIHVTLHDDKDAMLNYRAIPTIPDIRCIDIQCRSFDYNPWHISKHFERAIEEDGVSSDYTGPSPKYVTKYQGRIVLQGPDIKPMPISAETKDILIDPRWVKVFPVPPFESMLVPKTDARFPVFQHVKGDKGWFIKAWIPIETKFFEFRDTITFSVQVDSWIGDEETGGILKARTDFVISSLQNEREIDLFTHFERDACLAMM